MTTYRIQHPPTKTDVLTTDFMDVWHELERIGDGESITITKKEMTVKELEDQLKLNTVLNMSIRIPYGPIQTDKG